MPKIHYFMDELPQSLIINGSEIPINTDFRAVIKFDHLVKEDTGDGVKLAEALYIIFGTVPEDIDVALDELTDFITGGDIEEKPYKPSKKVLGINSAKAIDYYADDRMIWSAFYSAYRINLRTIDYLHWWDFVELLKELPETARIERVVHYRTVDTKSPRIGKEQKAVYEALQRYYKLTEHRSAEDELIAEALRQGKDPAQIINR